MSDADDLVAKIRAIADEVEGTATSVTERAQAAVDKAEQAVSKFKATLQSIMDNIAWIAGLPAVLGGGFGFLKSSADETAATDWQIDQLTERVAELESSNNLLGGDTKNFSLNLSDAPGGSMTAALVFVVFGVLIVGALWWQQKRRRR
jgi:hypothetical protein|tara:strand:- start:566 stop:1009 length:444 start_codon:yes stop_codon:yes gene_type:complete